MPLFRFLLTAKREMRVERGKRKKDKAKRGNEKLPEEPPLDVSYKQ